MSQQYQRDNANVFKLLNRVVDNTVTVITVDLALEKPPQLLRLKESNFVLTEDIKHARAAVTAHNLQEYRPSKLKMERLVLDIDVLLIDTLLKDLKEVRGCEIQSIE